RHPSRLSVTLSLLLSVSLSRRRSWLLATGSWPVAPQLCRELLLRLFLRRGGDHFGQLGDVEVGFFQPPSSDVIALPMDPGGVERVFAADDLEKAGGLHEGLLPETGNLLQLFAVLERTFLAAEFIDAACREGVHAGDITQQRRAGRIHINANEIDARF